VFDTTRGKTPDLYNSGAQSPTPISYGMNESLTGGVALASIPKPADTVFASDAIEGVTDFWEDDPTHVPGRATFPRDTNTAGWYHGPQSGVPEDWGRFCQHSGGNNYAFADGHVKFIQFRKMSEGNMRMPK
jgi:prepilin-type processing-associated H-X9-DG protein